MKYDNFPAGNSACLNDLAMLIWERYRLWDPIVLRLVLKDLKN